MTRSRKKTPCCHYVKKDTWFKTYFNRKLRRRPIDWDEGVSTISDGMAYRKANESCDIDDFRVVGTSYRQFGKWVDDKAENREMYERAYLRK